METPKTVSSPTDLTDEEYQQLRDSVYSICAAHFPHDLAEDATQHAFCKLCEVLQNGEHTIQDPLPWLTTVARNWVKDQFKKIQPECQSERIASLTMPATSENDTRYRTMEIQLDVLRRVFSSVVENTASPHIEEMRQLFSLMEQGASGREMARVLRITEGCVHERMSRLRKRLCEHAVAYRSEYRAADSEA